MTTVRMSHGPHGTLVVAPPGAPLTTDDRPGLDVLVLEVAGGHLGWSLLAGQRIPGAVLDDADAAQEWLWAVFGENVALAVADFDGAPAEWTAEPARPELVSSLWRLAYAQWAARWWPASTLDGIAALDQDVLAGEIGTLAVTCESVVDGADAPGDRDFDRAEDGHHAESRSRAEDYALAADGPAAPPGLVLARGSTGWDWRTCPPGVLDASEHAVSWQALRDAGRTTVWVSAVAAPDASGALPDHLHPHAVVELGGLRTDCVLRRRADSWTGEVVVDTAADPRPTVTVFVPGVGAGQPDTDLAARDLLRRYARDRLAAVSSGAAPDPRPLRAEVLAAESDTDF
ncbi:hypothetical protein ACFYTF_00285 [Nocardia thailandica]|uniref:Uncharacterized protein n=1 Tax=Nocardia thailandica TaxID=257275 RepID=A0ABW6PFT1_9NOCA